MKKQRDNPELNDLAMKGPLVDPGQSEEEEISGMVSAMLADHELYRIMVGQFHERIMDPGRPFKKRLQDAMRRGTFPRVEILVYQDGGAN